MKRFFYLFLTTIFIISCASEKALVFSESNMLYDEHAIIEINIPVAEGDTELAKKINFSIENHIANMLNFAEDYSETLQLKDAIKNFDDNYKAFKDDFEESNLVWEATFDGEVTYNSDAIISLAISNYSNTGGAHGNTNVTFFNFDKATGNQTTIESMLTDMESFNELAEKHFKESLIFEENYNYEDYFFGDDFQLPANYGFSDEGLILFYNTYEIAPYAMGITEFTIPFDELDELLKITL